MVFRESRYIDFNSGTVLKPPIDLLQEKPRRLSIDDMLDLFECRVEVWQLGPAVEIWKQHDAKKEVKSSPWAHSAYALLAIVFTYFEMIGKSLNPGSRSRGTAGSDFNYGFCDVYPSFASPSGQYTDEALPDVQQFRDRVRNGLYHLGYTKGHLFIHDEPRSRVPEDFWIDRTESPPRYFVNPHQVTRKIVDHFPGFIERVRSDNDLRDRFRRFFVTFHGLCPD